MDMLSKIENFWFYYKKHLLIGLAVLAVILYLGAQDAKAPEADYHIGIVRAQALPPETLTQLEQAVTAAGEDQNGDGVILVKLHSYNVDLRDPSGEKASEYIAALDADLIGKVSGIFLTEDYDGFQQATNNLLEEPFGNLEGLILSTRKDAEEAYLLLLEALQ